MSVIILAAIVAGVAGYVARALRPYWTVGIHGLKTYHIQSELARRGLIAMTSEDAYRASMAQQGSIKSGEDGEDDPVH